MLLATLREQTRTAHEGLERRLPLLSPDLALPTYRELMARLWGFYRPAEARLAAIGAWNALGLTAAERMKTRWLAEDLVALGADEMEALPHCTGLAARLSDAAAGVGCLYVLEGATLGGQLIRRRLAAGLGLGPTNGARFWEGYGRRVGPMWKTFCGALEGWGSRSATAERDRAVAAACDAFQSFDAWLSR